MGCFAGYLLCSQPCYSISKDVAPVGAGGSLAVVPWAVLRSACVGLGCFCCPVLLCCPSAAAVWKDLGACWGACDMSSSVLTVQFARCLSSSGSLGVSRKGEHFALCSCFEEHALATVVSPACGAWQGPAQLLCQWQICCATSDLCDFSRCQ